MTTNQKIIGPTPHYPYWRYLCPTTLHFWESSEKHDNGERTCPYHGDFFEYDWKST